MWIRVQASCACSGCQQPTPINAAVHRASCVHCGAPNQLSDALWQGTVSDMVARARKMDHNATYAAEHDVGNTVLRVSVTPTDPHCPDCDAPWTGVPDSCPTCGNAVHHREQYSVTLVSEDVAALAGERGETLPETMSCPSCGTPASIDGSSRNITCGSCSRDNVVPDYLWRRVHDPKSVGSWWWFVEGDGPKQGLSDALDGVNTLLCDSDTVYMLARYEYTPMLAAVRNKSFVWMQTLDDLGLDYASRISLGKEHLLAYSYNQQGLLRISRADGTVVDRLTLPHNILDLVEEADGTLLYTTVEGPKRATAAGTTLPTWPPFGCLFFWKSHAAEGVLSAMSGRLGQTRGPDVVATSGHKVARIRRDGSVAWTSSIPGGQGGNSAIAVAADGTVYVAIETTGTFDYGQTELAHEDDDLGALFAIPAAGGKATLLRRAAKMDYFTGVAVLDDGEVWLATGDGHLMAVDAEGQLRWKHTGRH